MPVYPFLHSSVWLLFWNWVIVCFSCCCCCCCCFLNVVSGPYKVGGDCHIFCKKKKFCKKWPKWAQVEKPGHQFFLHFFYNESLGIHCRCACFFFVTPTLLKLLKWYCSDKDFLSKAGYHFKPKQKSHFIVFILNWGCLKNFYFDYIFMENYCWKK